MLDRTQLARFEQGVLPHLGAAYNLARWLCPARQDAEDVVQEAYLRAVRFFAGFRGGDARPWLLAIVRNTCHTWVQKHRSGAATVPFDEKLHGPEPGADDPPALSIRTEDQQLVQRAIAELPVEFREVIVLRELEEMSYKEIAAVIDAPVGTVMSRLARGRERLHELLADRLSKET